MLIAIQYYYFSIDTKSFLTAKVATGGCNNTIHSYSQKILKALNF